MASTNTNSSRPDSLARIDWLALAIFLSPVALAVLL